MNTQEKLDVLLGVIKDELFSANIFKPGNVMPRDELDRQLHHRARTRIKVLEEALVALETVESFRGVCQL
jgi:hypothetical protein